MGLREFLFGKDTSIDYKAYYECMRVRWDNQDRMAADRLIRNEKRRRFDHEMQKCMRWQSMCHKLVFEYWRELDPDEYEEWMLNEGGPCLPISFGKMIKRFQQENKFIPLSIAAFI